MKDLMKNSRWRIIPFEYNQANYNMAVDEAIYKLYRKLKVNTLRFYGWKPSTVSIGHHQNLDTEVDFTSVEKNNFQIVRRITGGGAVFHDSEGELTYSVVTNIAEISSKSIEDSYYEIVGRLFEPLIKLGIPIDYNQIHCPSVFSNGKKISGNAQARSGGTILQHGTLLVDYRPEIMYSVLKARPGRTQSDMVASVYQKITTVQQQLKRELSVTELAKFILDELLSKYPQNFYLGSLNDDERNLAVKIMKSRYQSSNWLKMGKFHEKEVY